MQEKKIYLILLPSILVFLGIVGFLVFSGVLKPRIELGKQAPLTGEIEQDNQQGAVDIVQTPTTSTEGDFLKLADETKDASKCLGFSDERYVAACAAEIGRRTSDAGACSVIKNQVEMVKCVDMVSFDKAFKGGDIKDCIKIGDDNLSQSCVVNIIDSKELQLDDCQVLPERERDFCKGYLSYLNDMTMAKTVSLESDCQSISNESAKAHCLDRFPIK
jgi:hypothetical protein